MWVMFDLSGTCTPRCNTLMRFPYCNSGANCRRHWRHAWERLSGGTEPWSKPGPACVRGAKGELPEGARWDSEEISKVIRDLDPSVEVGHNI